MIFYFRLFPNVKKVAGFSEKFWLRDILQSAVCSEKLAVHQGEKIK
jgi:hypothetical protein